MENERLKKEIMEQSRHLFIYGYKGENRDRLVQEMVRSYPPKWDTEEPVAVYLEKSGLKKVPIDRSLDGIKINAIAREYLNFNMAYTILKDAMATLPTEELGKRLQDLLDHFHPSSAKPKDIEELLRLLKTSKEFYESYYDVYTSKGEDLNINDLKMPFLLIELWLSQYKEAMQMDSHFGIIVDKKEPMALPSVKNLNVFVGSRINKDISMKIVTDPADWESYRDSNGEWIEAVHDYGTVELDDCIKEYRKQ